MLKTKITISMFFFAVLTIFFIADKSGLSFFAVLFSFLHELGHFLALLCVKTIPKEIKISLFGIEMILPERLSTAKKTAVLMAGFTVNFILSAFFFAAEKLLFAYINLAIGTITFLPLASTDGGSILKIILEEFCYEKAVKLFKIFTAFFGLIFSGLLFLMVFYSKNYFLFLAIVYIMILTIKEAASR